MLSHYLIKALEDLEQLITLTSQDIEDIKLAKHEEIFQRAELKEEFITTFQSKKTLIDNEIAKQMQHYPDLELKHLLEEEDTMRLTQLKEKLLELKALNKRYAKLVLTVSEFYNSLLEKMVPVEMDGYDKVAPKHRALLEVHV